ncbi:MAG: MTH938/NDUFAF3 family protein [Chiayiivirga sp.]|jgi:uncharacterized protein|uniref:Mth938-like domain-containing protein n=1 Tax=Chiayiivirga sp. TaxID=2041042 RepID=UPI0025B7E646|nr:MTH938/NDUFAF3 family protein [Chiayiivirga sp.]MCI1730276.1 MTH938/NDUFAF3 family protein [Chiayiivirga sp.]
MSLLEERPEGLHLVRWVRIDAVAVGSREFVASFLLAPDAVRDHWAPCTPDQIDDAAIAEVLALEPALVLLGTGQHQRLPTPKLLAEFLRRGIGLEAMDNAAAARTYNLLAGEGRRVVAAFLLGET